MNLKENKKSIKEEIDRPTWSKWVVNNIHHIEYFFNGKIVDKKMLNSLFESEGFDTDVDMVEDELKKAVRSVRLGNLDGNALHIAHNSVGNRIDLVFDIGGLMAGVESLSNDECVIRINGDIYEQDEMWNFGFAIYLTCGVHPLDFALAESNKFIRQSIKESINFPKALDILEDGGILYANIGKKQVEIGIDKELGGYYVRGNDWYDNYMSAEKLLMDLKDRGAIFKLKESTKKSARKSLKESAKPINEKNVAKFVYEVNKWCDDNIHYVDIDAENFTKKYGKLYNFKYRKEDDFFVIYDSEGTLDLFDREATRVYSILDKLAKKNGWYIEPYSCACDFTFGEL